jgi:3-phosphoglycerate kinase
MVQFGLQGEVDWLSTGGGASLELLEGKKLPGVESLIDAKTAAPAGGDA